MNYYKLLTRLGYPSDCFIVGKIYPETFRRYENDDWNSVLEMQRAYPNDWKEVPAGEYFVQEGKMPEYFAIKRVDGNPLWGKYINWFGKKYNHPFDGTASWYGFDGSTSYSGMFWSSLNRFKNNPVELTLEQWDKIINKTMEEKFKLPEKWCVLSQGKDTYEKYLQSYLVKYGYENPEWNGRDYYYSYVKGEFYADNYPEIRGCVEIAFEQFIKHVLKEEVMKENDKEIIGWKLKDDCKKNSKAAFYICTGYTNNNGIYGNVESSHDIKKLKDAGVLELWFEPVYKEKTPQITINGYKGEFFDNYVKFGCAEIDKNWFLQFYEIMRTVTYSNKEIEFVAIGKGTFTKDQIKEIAEYYLNKE